MRDRSLMGSIRGWIVVGSLGVLVACPVKSPVGPESTLERCTDPYSCTDPNGTGIYTAEGGSAGIGPARLMIFRFHSDEANTEASVSFDGAYRLPLANPSTGAPLVLWRPVSGSVYGATYLEVHNRLPLLHEGLVVRSVTERNGLLPPHVVGAPDPRGPASANAIPTWTLRDQSLASITVTGDELRNLTLFVRFSRPGSPEERYAINFSGPAAPHPVTGDQRDRSISEYWMQWTPIDPQTNQPDPQGWQSYCRSGSLATADSVVFQQGFDIDPITGRITTPSDGTTHVTLSCYLGAPATVFRWRYDYRDIASPDGFFFKAAIQMKRASYCGDASHYTVAGTPIQISDTHQPPIHDDIQRPVPPAAIEASWSEDGACCLDPRNVRVPALGPSFGGTCRGQPVPPCTPDSMTCPSQKTAATAPRQLLDEPLRH